MTKFLPPTPPFIAARYSGGSQKPKAIVIHATVSSDNPGTARNIAGWWNGPTSPKSSAHYTVDPGEVIQSVGDHTVAYHCGYNQDSIGVELCDEQTGPASRWQDADSLAILQRAARLVAELCLAYGISTRRPTIAALKLRGPHGIYGHNDSRLAFGGTTHSDPRDFPWEQFIRLVRLEKKRIKNEAKKAKAIQRAKPKTERQFKVLHAPLHGASATKGELRKALKRKGVVAITFSEAYRFGPFLRNRPRWRGIVGAAKPIDSRGRMVKRDVAIVVRKSRRALKSALFKVADASEPLKLAPERYLAYTVDNVHGKPLAVITLHPHADVRSGRGWRTDRGRKYRGAMAELYHTVNDLRSEYGQDLDIIVTGDLQYAEGDPIRQWSPRWVFTKLDMGWAAAGVNWMAHSSGLRLVNPHVIPKQVNGQDHPWIENTYERI